MQIKKFRTKKGVSLREMSDALHIAISTLHGYETGLREPTLDTLKSIADYFGVSVDRLIDHKTTRIRVIGDISAGIPTDAVEDFSDDCDFEEIDGSPREYFALRIKGTSMSPKMSAGDVVIVHKQNEVDNGDIAVVLVGDEATCKKVKYTKNGLYLLGLNPNFDPIFYTPEECESMPVRVLGKVVELRCKF